MSKETFDLGTIEQDDVAAVGIARQWLDGRRRSYIDVTYDDACVVARRYLEALQRIAELQGTSVDA
jgi:uncharacterized protein (UPF0128 family)